MNEFNEFIINFVAESDPEFAEKLKAYDRAFSPEEMISLIHYVRYSTLAEKHEAYKGLISQFPDHILEWNGDSRKVITLRDFLTACIKNENMLIEKFKSDEYCDCYQGNSRLIDDSWNDKERFSTYKEAIAYYKCLNSKRYVLHQIDKVYSRSDDSYISVKFRASDMSILDVSSVNVLPEKDDYFKFVWLKVGLRELL